MDTIFSILAWLLPTKSVDGIVRQLGKLAARLADAEAKQQAKALGIGEQIVTLQAQRGSALLEADRAARVRTKINDLIA